MANAKLTEIYAAARSGGVQAATVAVMKALKDGGVSKNDACAQAADLSWHIETGGPAPEWLDSYGEQTAASMAFERECERRDMSQ